MEPPGTPVSGPDWSRLWLAVYEAATGAAVPAAAASGAAVRGPLEVGDGLLSAPLRAGNRTLHPQVLGRPAAMAALGAELASHGLHASELSRDDVRRLIHPWLSVRLRLAGLRASCPCGSGPRCEHLAALALAFAGEIARQPLRLLEFVVARFGTLRELPAGRWDDWLISGRRFWWGPGGEAPPQGPNARPTSAADPREAAVRAVAAATTAAPADLLLRIGPPPPVQGRTSDVDVPAVMGEVRAALRALAGEDVEAAIARVPFGLPASGPGPDGTAPGRPARGAPPAAR